MPRKLNPDTQALDNILRLFTHLLVHAQPISLTALTKRSWILGFGDDAEVVSPEWLQEDIVNTVQSMMKRYED